MKKYTTCLKTVLNVRIMGRGTENISSICLPFLFRFLYYTLALPEI